MYYVVVSFLDKLSLKLDALSYDFKCNIKYKLLKIGNIEFGYFSSILCVIVMYSLHICL